jgi:hypothetical protein
MRTIAIVGNGSFDRSHSSLIDNADLVVRFNDCRSYGVGGTKTDIVAVCNTGRPGLSMMTGDSWTSSPAVRNASEIWCVRDIRKFRELQSMLTESILILAISPTTTPQNLRILRAGQIRILLSFPGAYTIGWIANSLGSDLSTISSQALA